MLGARGRRVTSQMGGSGSTPKPLASQFGADTEAKRGPTLGSLLLPGPEAGSWRLTLVAPLRIQVFEGRTARPLPLEDTSATSAISEHAPFTAFCASEEPDPSSGSEARQQPRLVVGCQDGTILVFALSKGMVSGPLHELKPQEGTGESPRAGEGIALAMSITALHLTGRDELFAGSCSRCFFWNVMTGELQREFHLPGPQSGNSHPATPSSLVAVRQPYNGEEDPVEATHLWVGLDNGHIAVFDVQTGFLARSFKCIGPEAVTSLAYFATDGVIFALSAHRRVSVWEVGSYTCLQKYPADLMTCGSDLSAMVAIDYKAMVLNLLVLAGVDGSLCVRRVSRRGDGKLNCVLLFYLESVSGDLGCPITSIGYHAATDSIILGDAGCTVALVMRLKEQLGHAATLPAGGGALPSRENTALSREGTAFSREGTAVSTDNANVLPARAEPPSQGAAPEPDVEAAVASIGEVVPKDDASPKAENFPVFQGSD